MFTQGARELVATDPVLASQSLGLLRGYLREVLRNAGDGSGYECQEDEGAFMRLWRSEELELVALRSRSWKWPVHEGEVIFSLWGFSGSLWFWPESGGKLL